MRPRHGRTCRISIRVSSIYRRSFACRFVLSVHASNGRNTRDCDIFLTNICRYCDCGKYRQVNFHGSKAAITAKQSFQIVGEQFKLCQNWFRPADQIAIHIRAIKQFRLPFRVKVPPEAIRRLHGSHIFSVDGGIYLHGMEFENWEEKRGKPAANGAKNGTEDRSALRPLTRFARFEGRKESESRRPWIPKLFSEAWIPNWRRWVLQDGWSNNSLLHNRGLFI